MLDKMIKEIGPEEAERRVRTRFKSWLAWQSWQTSTPHTQASFARSQGITRSCLNQRLMASRPGFIQHLRWIAEATEREPTWFLEDPA